MQNSSCTAGRKWAYGTTSTVRMSSWSELRAEVLRRPRRARTSAADGRRQQQQVVAHVHDILLALLRDVARPAATRVREVGRRARAAAARRRDREAMSARAGRRGSGRWTGVARLGRLPRDLNARRLRQNPPNRGSEGYCVTRNTSESDSTTMSLRSQFSEAVLSRRVSDEADSRRTHRWNPFLRRMERRID